MELPVHPHIKLTREIFPRALATRIVKEDGDEYFGAFLNRTSVRILIDFLNRTFKLRSCAIEIDGSFEVPCTQFYAKRCVAPCVASLCDRESYIEIVDLVRLFLRNDRELFLAAVNRRIELAADALDFESAVFLRDMLQAVDRYWSQPRYQVWLDDTVDTFELYEDDDAMYAIVITQRGRRTLGELVYSFYRPDDPTTALHRISDELYMFHLPREIRVSHDFPGRNELAKELGRRFGKPIAIKVAGEANRRISAERAVAMTKARLELARRTSKLTLDQLLEQIRNDFGLSFVPYRIECFDVAHISATGFAAAVSVWRDGEDRPDEYEHWLSDRTSELDTLRAFVAARVARTSPDLILIDGGRSHLNAAIESAAETAGVISAVKPRGKHASISHFLRSDGTRVDFDQDNESHRLLQRLRDEAHDLANGTHRLSRDMMHFYELAAALPSLDEPERQRLLREVGSIRKAVELDEPEFVSRFGERGKSAYRDAVGFRTGMAPAAKPLIVPIRFVETDGAAEDLIPIETRG